MLGGMLKPLRGKEMTPIGLAGALLLAYLVIQVAEGVGGGLLAWLLVKLNFGFGLQLGVALTAILTSAVALILFLICLGGNPMMALIFAYLPSSLARVVGRWPAWPRFRPPSRRGH